MARGIYTRWIIGGISLLVIVFVVCMLWYKHTTPQYREQLTDTYELLPREENGQQDKPQIITNSSSESVEYITDITGETITDTIQERNTTGTEKSKPKMSPFGLGLYPEIPEDWNTPYLWNGCDTIYDELLTRVNIKMHNEGILSKYSSVGIDHGSGLITPIEHGSVLVEYETDQNGEHVIYRVLGHPDAVPTDAATIWKRVTDIPSHLKIVTPEEISIDPYEYLGLQN
ncbi:hypothetical protein F4083_04430 [Candidatus Poribacteria bacterium]|nr:hypothetical protein [Candidatus Poribacteria bacterium]MYB63741.1 hypothetical protein [Candidatus Poribacteria bacterium]MYF56149.1 hypothetical protein [Candidatus Poribacteria bacterium]MYI93557.1 hypothetical protein [Candidatus Poribacteria bacterium]